MLDTFKRTTPEARGLIIPSGGEMTSERRSIHCSLSFVCERSQESWDRHDGKVEGSNALINDRYLFQNLVLYNQTIIFFAFFFFSESLWLINSTSVAKGPMSFCESL